MSIIGSAVKWCIRTIMKPRNRRILYELTRNSPVRIVIGAGRTKFPGWAGTDIDTLNLLAREDWDRYFTENSIDSMLAEHVWEHLTDADAVAAARNCFFYMRPGGRLRVAVPDGLHPDPAYIEYVRPGGSGLAAEDHKILHTYRTFAGVFEAAGFEVKCLEYFDEDSRFHCEQWDPEDGLVLRSDRFDNGSPRALKLKPPYKYTSIIIDAIKPMVQGAPAELADERSLALTP